MPKKKIKILHLIPTLDKGGAERLLVDLVKKIDKNVFNVEVLSMTTLGKWGFELKKAGIPVSSLGKRNKGSILTLWRLYKIFKNKKLDVLHTHLFGADLYGLLVGRLAKVPYIVLTEHNLNYGEGRIRRYIKKKIVPKMDKVFTVSSAVKSYLRNEGIETDNVEVIYNGVDLKRFKPKDNQSDSKGFIIGSIGRMSAQKDYNTLINAFTLLKDENVSCLAMVKKE